MAIDPVRPIRPTMRINWQLQKGKESKIGKKIFLNAAVFSNWNSYWNAFWDSDWNSDWNSGWNYDSKSDWNSDWNS